MKTFARILAAGLLALSCTLAHADLSPAKIATLRPVVQAEPTLAQAIATGDDYAIAAWLNAAFVPDFFVWRTSMNTGEVYDSIVWANLTPADTPDGTQLWLNRALAAQGKQFNIQTLLQGRDTINPARANVRAGLQDALTGLPTGPAGATRAAGWVALQLIMSRKARRAEKTLSTGPGTQATPATMVFEGTVSAQEASLMR